jgi:hypothetical protein
MGDPTAGGEFERRDPETGTGSVSDPGEHLPADLPGAEVGREFVFAPRIVHGGAKSRIKGKGYEGHHISSWDAIKRAWDAIAKRYGLPDLSYGEAPAVRLKRKHHHETPTHGRQGGLGAMNRALQAELIKDLQFDVAQDLDIGFILKAWPGVYDQAIREALEYTIGLGLRKDYGPWSSLFDRVLERIGNQKLELHHFK